MIKRYTLYTDNKLKDYSNLNKAIPSLSEKWIINKLNTPQKQNAKLGAPVVSLYISYKDGHVGAGTGFVVGKNTILTAAHCVTELAINQNRNDPSTFIPNITITFRDGTVMQADEVHFPELFFSASGFSSHHDYGIIKINNADLSKYNTYRLGIMTGEYNGTLYGEGFVNSNKYTTVCSPLNVNYTNFTVNSSITPGMSGGPMSRINSDFTRTVVGINRDANGTVNRITPNTLQFVYNNPYLK